MKINLTHKEANLLNAIIWELAEGRGIVHGEDVWRLSWSGRDICQAIADKMEAANLKSGKPDLSGSPKGSIESARWSA